MDAYVPDSMSAISNLSGELMRRFCKAVNERGEACRQWPLTGKDFCFWHDPDSANEAAEARPHGRRQQEEGANPLDDLRR